MKIGIDMDDTIINTYDYLIDKIADYYKVEKEELRSRALSYDDFLNNEEFPNYSIYAEENYGKYINNVPIKDDAVLYINKLHDEGNEIVIVTARHVGEYDNPYEITENYLLKHNIPYNKIIVGALDKGKVCEDEQIDLFIDDSIDNCSKVNQHGIEVLLFDAKYNKHNNTFKRVNNWQEVYNIIKKND